MTVSPTSGWLDSAALLAPSGPARTRTSLCSNSRALLPLDAAMLAVMRRRPESSLRHGHPWPAMWDAVAFLHDRHLRLRGGHTGRRAAQARRLARAGDADRQRGQQVRVHAAIHRAGSALP